MTKKFVLAFLAAVIFVSSSVFGVAPQPARADTNSTIAIAAAAAAIGLLLFDSNNRPYYVRNNHRYYVSQPVATYYVQHRDPQWYSQHQNDWQNNRGNFAQAWNRDHNGQNHGQGNGHGH